MNQEDKAKLDEFLRQTAEDYAIDLHKVKELYKKHQLDFYTELENMVQENMHKA